MNASRIAIFSAALPSVLMLALFYSLAIHMRRSLGGWPNSIGEDGFPPSLLGHSAVTILFFEILLLINLFVVPVAIVTCATVKRWRCFVPYLALFVFLFVVSWGLMQLAPEPFLYWWRD